MTSKNKERMREALSTAAEMIRGHSETGLDPEDVNELDEKGLAEYAKACIKVSNILYKLEDKYK